MRDHPAPASPLSLARLAWGDRWLDNAHLDRLNELLLKVASGEIRRLMVNMPPRHGKSVLVSETFPAWFIGRNPQKRVILASYQAEFAASWGRRARALLNRFGMTHFDVRVSRESSAAAQWDIAGHRGGMSTAGAGGAITGKGADILIIDDPIKNSQEANSFVIRERIWEWYRSTAYTRLEPNGSIVVIQTRWHDDDLSGRLLKDIDLEGRQWQMLNLPALAGADDALGRKEGEALWPARYPVQELEAIRADVGDYVFAALYQQDPPSKLGVIFKPEWFRYWELRGDYYQLFGGEGELLAHFEQNCCERFTIVDCAASSDDEAKERKGKPPSDSVVTTFDYHRATGNLIVRDMAFGRWAFPELSDQLRNAYTTHKPAWIGIENEKTGIALYQSSVTMPVRPISHEGKDKLTRSARAQNQMRQGKVFIGKAAPWRRAFERELTSWTGMQDEKIDMGDTLFYACLHADDYAGGQINLSAPIMSRRI